MRSKEGELWLFSLEKRRWRRDMAWVYKTVSSVMRVKRD